MKSVAVATAVWSLVVVSVLPIAAAFVSPRPDVRTSTVVEVGYVPDGMSPDQYKKLMAKEKSEKSKKKFGAFGPQSFQSRSLQSFQSEMEQGKAGHLMPVFNAKDKIKRGQLKEQDVPYMQRGGHWDDSDVKGAKKKQWNDVDKKYQSTDKAPKKIGWW